ncbi:DUF3489 domain-containing protein [Defluviimonas sp. WL0024]|uniref:DUF3489 domain-containing protein n=2 Tax=Albidovulum TaxID=205889 RepID=A0ABT3J628_9RHOB|nr:MULTISPECIES: DUF3489 domain-containing protein [Defluviimonas]MCU9849533.1 DUF3489 domain-containing protein [Defluviimonas sp. WL0024]MCW3783134.1 DUF3489 domain-containing protein [Defluviimonas salinarum]
MTIEAMTTRSGRKSNPKSGIKRVSKKDQLIRMLSTTTGADVATISRKLGWQPHTVRAALTGLRKAGYEVAAETSGQGKPARYRIVFAASAMESTEAAAIRSCETTDAG